MISEAELLGNFSVGQQVGWGGSELLTGEIMDHSSSLSLNIIDCRLGSNLKSERIQRNRNNVVKFQIPASVRKVCSLLWMLLSASFLQLADVMMSRQSVKHVSL